VEARIAVTVRGACAIVAVSPPADQGAAGPDIALEPEPVQTLEPSPLHEVQRFDRIVQPLAALGSGVRQSKRDP